MTKVRNSSERDTPILIPGRRPQSQRLRRRRMLLVMVLVIAALAVVLYLVFGGALPRVLPDPGPP